MVMYKILIYTWKFEAQETGNFVVTEFPSRDAAEIAVAQLNTTSFYHLKLYV
jgi:hypothetical protein